MKKIFCIIAAIIALLPPTPGAAHAEEVEEQYMELAPVVVTARGVPSLVSKTPGGIGVADEEDIAATAKSSVADALSRISGVSAGGESPWGRDISVRGLGGSSVVVLIDGMRVNTATDVNARLGFINPQDVERIEVLKGPVSSLYGSGSTGGVINVITKKGAFLDAPEIYGELSNTYSTNTEGTDSYAAATYGDQRFWITASGAHRGHEDYRDGDGTTITNSEFEDTQGRVAMGVKWNEDLTSRLQVMALEANEVGIPGGSSTMPQNAPITYPRTGNILVGLDNGWDVNGEYLRRLELKAYTMRNDRRVRIENPNPAVNQISTQAEHETWGGDLRAMVEAGAHSIVTGVEAWNWHMQSDRRRHFKTRGVAYDDPIPNTAMLSMGAFAEDDWELSPELTANIGARADRVKVSCNDSTQIEENSETDVNWNAHLGLTHDLPGAWSHSIIGATSFRSADVMERYKYINLGGGKTLEGNAGLSPEKSWFAEYGLRHYGDTVYASASAFVNMVRDLITEKQASANVTKLDNVGKARLLGFELEGEWQFAPQWSLYGEAAYIDGRDLKADEPLGAIAPLNGKAGIRHDYDCGLWWRAEMDWATSKKKVPQGVDQTAGWATANLAAGLELEKGRFTHEFIVRLDNLLDRRYINHLANSRGIELAEPGFNAALTYTLGF